MPSSALLTEKACTAAAAAAQSARACMHAHNSSSIDIGRRPPFGSVTRSWIWIRAFEDGFFLFFGVWIRRIGPIFSLPQLAIELTSTPTMLDSSRHRSSISLTTASGNHVKHSFRKARQLWTLSKLPSPCDYFEKRTKEQQGKKFFSTQSTVIVSPLHPASSARTSRPVLSESAAVQRVS